MTTINRQKNVSIDKQWFEYAHADLDAAKRLFVSSRPTQWTYLLTLWHCHQTIEKGIKAIIIKREKELLKIHDLLRLVSLADLALSAHDRELVRRLNKYYLCSRYPDLLNPPFPKTKRGETKMLLHLTEKFFLWLQQQ